MQIDSKEPEVQPQPDGLGFARRSGFGSGRPYLDPPAPQRRPRRGVGIVLLAGLAAAGVALLSMHWHGGSSSSLPAASPPARSLDLSAADQDRVLAARLRAGSGAALVPEGFDPGLLAEVGAGERALYLVRVLDTVAQDGDVVTVFVDERPVAHVVLSNAGSVLRLPLRAGSAANVRFLAKHDGGGGVTFAASSSLGQASTRVMAVGESESWTVRVVE